MIMAHDVGTENRRMSTCQHARTPRALQDLRAGACGPCSLQHLGRPRGKKNQSLANIFFACLLLSLCSLQSSGGGKCITAMSATRPAVLEHAIFRLEVRRCARQAARSFMQ